MPGSVDPTAQIKCPHGGTAVVATGNTKARTKGGGIVLQDDILTVGGCTFTLPNGKPSPCVKVKWAMTDTKVKVDGKATVSQTSVGNCYSAEEVMQGPAIISSVQGKVKSS